MVRGLLASLVVGLTLHAAPARAERPRVPISKHPLAQPSTAHRTVVKFVDAAQVRGGDANPLRAVEGRGLEPLRALLRARGLRLTPIFADPGPALALAERARRRSGRAQPDLLGLYEVHGASLQDARALQQLDVVEFVSMRAASPPPPVDIDPPTPELVDLQGYLGPAPGVDAFGAWASGYRGESVRLADVEYAWALAHEEWNEGSLVLEPGQTPDLEALQGITDENHGTAVAGVLIGGDDGYGVTGIAPGSTLGVYPELSIEQGSRRPEAIIAAAADADVGDVILLEMQIGEPITGLLGPAEIDEAVWMATRMATDAGVVVVATAGNGGLDLDRDELAYYRDRGDSGAIMVGAGAPNSHSRLGFSTYGTRVDVQGWGGEVFTTGYGDFAIYGMDPNQRYTALFAGTSSAGPIVAGVCALVQDAVKSERGVPLSSQQMRVVLRGTGLPQPDGDSGHIGPLPQAPAAIAAALVPPTQPPSVQISSPAAMQTEDSTFTTTIEIDASDDTAFVQLSINGEVQSVVDHVPPFSFAEVSFPVGTWEVVAIATNVWEIEGTSDPVTLDVGVTPPPETSSGDGSSSGDGPLTSGTGPGGDTSGNPDPTVTSTGSGEGSSSGSPAAGSGGGGCRAGGRPPLVLSLGLLLLWRRRSTAPFNWAAQSAKPRSRISAPTSASRPRNAR